MRSTLRYRMRNGSRFREAIPDTKNPARDPLAPAYQVGDTVYLDDTAFVIENIGTFDVQLRDPAQRYPIFRSESRERFEQLLQYDIRNGPITEFSWLIWKRRTPICGRC